jgi:hypothetical protein
VLIRVNKSLSPSQSNDVISVSGVLTNIGRWHGDRDQPRSDTSAGATPFFVFNKAMSNGAAMTVIGGGVAWTNKLAVNGSIAVISPPDVGVLGDWPVERGFGAEFHQHAHGHQCGDPAPPTAL